MRAHASTGACCVLSSSYRSVTGRPRRTSRAFFASQRAKLRKCRDWVRVVFNCQAAGTVIKGAEDAPFVTEVGEIRFWLCLFIFLKYVFLREDNSLSSVRFVSSGLYM